MRTRRIPEAGLMNHFGLSESCIHQLIHFLHYLLTKNPNFIQDNDQNDDDKNL